MATVLATETSNISQSCSIGYRGKRLIDVVLSVLAIVLLAPALLVIALAIKISSPGPIFFRQRRLGLNERPFTIFKFRSMRVDAQSVGPRFTTDHDPRITAIGKIIRRTSLDELPQLFNVLRGDMSFLGPRPYVGFELENWTAEQRAVRASVRPGISGMAQIHGRSSLTPDEGRRLDLEYVNNCTMAVDLRLIVGTVGSVLSLKGTN